MSSKQKGEYEVAIVGGGPAGLSAAVWLARYLHSVVLVDSGDPRNWETRGVNGYLGLPAITPPELRERGRAECRNYGVELVDAICEGISRKGDECFVLHIESEIELSARRLLLAIGIRDVWPEIPGLGHVYGSAAHVCPDCDGYEARGQKVVVLGNGRKAVGLALNLTTWTRDIIICTNGDDPRLEPEYCEKLDALNIPVIASRVTCVRPSGSRIHCLQLEDGFELDADRIFFTMGQHAAGDLGTRLGCQRDEDGQIVVDDHYHTSVRHVFAAGDIVPGPQLAIAAAADGAIAALAIHKSLVPDARKLRPRGAHVPARQAPVSAPRRR
jgi:thioredoxin reductase (NADPH)